MKSDEIPETYIGQAFKGSIPYHNPAYRKYPDLTRKSVGRLIIDGRAINAKHGKCHDWEWK